jgi:DNA-binding FrmR family transcriptional regulator
MIQYFSDVPSSFGGTQEDCEKVFQIISAACKKAHEVMEAIVSIYYSARLSTKLSEMSKEYEVRAYTSLCFSH